MAENITPMSNGFVRVLIFLWVRIKKIPPVYIIFIAIFTALIFLSPNKYQSMPGIMTFLRSVAPFAVLAIGEMLVLTLGGFDLSVGAVVSFVVFVSTKLLANDPANTYPVMLFMLGMGVLIGLINGLIVNYLKVPSFIATLGMMQLVRGAALYYIGGAPQGYLTENWRMWGRSFIEDVPFFEKVPYALIVMVVVGIIIYFLFHWTNYGKQVLAIGDNMRAAYLSGTKVKLIRTLTFILCSVCAVIAGILIGGVGGVNIVVGQGLEIQAIVACVVGGIIIGGGKGSVLNAIFGAITLQAIVNLLIVLGLPRPYTEAVQGLIIIGAVAYSTLSLKRLR